MTYISNGRIITQNRVETGAVLIDNGKIKAICSAGTAPPKGVEIFDAAGAYVSPGFIDIHNHGRLGASIEDLSEQSLETIACGQLAAGVTGFLAGPSTMQWERYLQAIRLIARWCEKHETGSST